MEGCREWSVALEGKSSFACVVVLLALPAGCAVVLCGVLFST